MWEEKDEQPVEQPERGKPEGPPAEKSEVSARGGKQGKASDAKSKPDGEPDPRKQLEEMRKELEETRASEKFWAEKARGAKAADSPPDDDEEPDEPEDDDDDDDEELKDDSPDKAFEDFSAKGIEALVKRGVLTKKAARQIIERAATKIATKIARTEVGKARRELSQDAELASQYPELQDEKSELFVKTREIYRGMVKDDPALKRSPAALKMAARQAKLELQLTERAEGRRNGEEERRDRIRRQGETGSRRNVEFIGEDEGDDKLSPAQQKILNSFNADGTDEISEDAYLKRAKAGVRMSTRSSNGAYRSGSVSW